jgi:aerobic carbon-monoxide dehydrogenase medium subunit
MPVRSPRGATRHLPEEVKRLMKPAPFRYHGPTSVAEALGVLAEAGGDGKVLAGGQSLIPILNMRLASPHDLVDINRVGELDTVTAGADGVRIGALARHARVEADDEAFATVPLLRQALQFVAHPVIRNRGTTVGSLVHADPSGEMTAVLALLGGSVEVASHHERRTIMAGDFFVAPLESAVAPGELAVSAFFPRLPGRTGTAFTEVARRHGDYAVCGVAAAVTIGDDLRITSARTAYISVGPTPVVMDVTETLTGATVGTADWAAAGRLAGSRVDPEPDIHATAEYRRHLVMVLTGRVLREAASRAAGHPEPGPAAGQTERGPAAGDTERGPAASEGEPGT